MSYARLGLQLLRTFLQMHSNNRRCCHDFVDNVLQTQRRPSGLGSGDIKDEGAHLGLNIHSSRCSLHRARSQEQADSAATTKGTHSHRNLFLTLWAEPLITHRHTAFLHNELDNGKISQFLQTCEQRLWVMNFPTQILSLDLENLRVRSHLGINCCFVGCLLASCLVHKKKKSVLKGGRWRVAS